jgi:hypothetical protein
VKPAVLLLALLSACGGAAPAPVFYDADAASTDAYAVTASHRLGVWSTIGTVEVEVRVVTWPVTDALLATEPMWTMRAGAYVNEVPFDVPAGWYVFSIGPDFWTFPYAPGVRDVIVID